MIKFLRSESSLVFFICVASIFYLINAIRQSLSIENLIFVLPLSLVTVCLGATLIWRDFRANVQNELTQKIQVTQNKDTISQNISPLDPKNAVIRSLLLMLVFSLFIFALIFGPFDFLSIIFTLCGIYILGERRPLFLVLYSVAVGLTITGLFSYLLPYPMTTIFFGS